MQLSHDPAAVDAVFDEGNLVSCAGLAPVLALAERAGLSELLAEHVSVPSPNAPAKVTSLAGGHGRRSGLDRCHGSAAARCDGPAVYRGAGAEHVGHVPAGVQ